MKPRHLVLGAALAGAALLVLFGERAPDTEVAEAVERAPGPRTAAPAAPAFAPAAAPAAADTGALAAATPAAATAAASMANAARILALVPRETLIGDSTDQFQQGENGVFGRKDWTPPPPPPPAPPPPPPPSAPPLPFTFIGKSVADGAWEVYLARGDRTYVVRDKTVIDGMYRVDAIAPPVLTLTYLPLNTVQQLNIGVFD
jgi:pyruvate/2-oxoglutarate dehydrogenase complex dihydrolipoamide acyltransferase (E2) component